jgi:hypothetical protein
MDYQPTIGLEVPAFAKASAGKHASLGEGIFAIYV